VSFIVSELSVASQAYKLLLVLVVIFVDFAAMMYQRT
jgi:hypothetical protein